MDEVRSSSLLRSTISPFSSGIDTMKQGWYHEMAFRPARMEGFLYVSFYCVFINEEQIWERVGTPHTQEAWELWQ